MALWNGKKSDPIAARSRALNQEIEALKAQIHKLGSELQREETASPRVVRGNESWGGHLREPVFEAVNHQRVTTPSDRENPTEQYNELGVRKYDLAGAWRRFARHFRGPPASNPKLINYLAAGSIQGLRPLRYEKRVARNRVLVLALILALMLLGIISVFLRH
jgi:cell division protein FtsB